MIRVVVTGSECTGKTTLVKALAEHYETVCVPEFIRGFVIEKDAPPTYEDVEPIARGQMALEDEHISVGTRLLIHDTDLLSAVVYNHHYYGECPGWIEDACAKRAADLYLLAGIDVPWIADGWLRDRGDRREEMQELFRNALLDRRLNFTEIRGEHHERLAEAVSAIDSLILGRAAKQRLR
ncbi:MAG TPA: ATP-binding protein [Vicinamibacteria bacterium]|jgi:NadR type nicotinamide-nucleotide adenylyltransferase